MRRVANTALLVAVLASGVCGSVCAVPPPPAAPPGATSEARIKAGIVFNLARVVDWPEMATAANTFVIGVVGDDAADPALDGLSGKDVHRRACVVRDPLPPQAAAEAQIVYISQSQQADLQSLLGTLAGHPVLTVSEIGGFCESGGMVQLRRDRNRILLRVNREAAEKAGLRLSSELLKVAELVKGGD